MSVKQPILTRIYHFLKGPNPLHPTVWQERLSPLTFRRFATADAAQCLELYALNESGRFPEGVMEQYRKHLTEQSSCVLVSEREHQLIAAGGVHYFLRDDIAVLCFGLVRPDYQGRGIGTALLLARLALLDTKRPRYRVLIFAVERSFAFYRRFGFQTSSPWQDTHGNKHPSGCLLITSTEIRCCRRLLGEHGISIPLEENMIPLQEVAEP